MAASDAMPVPKKNVAFRHIFPIFDADGDLVTGATGLDSEVSKDCGTMTDCTNEATEIATASGMYYLDLTATEMNADSVTIVVKTTSSGAKTTPMVLYPEEDGDIRVTAVAVSDKTGYTLSSAGVQAIWDALSSALTTAGSIGKRLVDYVTGDIFGRVGAPVGASISADIAAVQSDTNDIQTRIPAALVGGKMDSTGGASAGDIADAVWDEAIAGHTTPGSTGEALASAGAAGDPWGTPLPGAYAAGSAGKIVGDMLDVPVSSRLAPTTPGNTLDVNSDGEAGIDWANVGGQAAIVNLTNTGILAVGDGFGAIFATGDVVDATGTTTLLDAGAQAIAGFYVGARLRIASGTGQNQERIITDYTAGRVATHAEWVVTPDATSTYEIEPGRSALSVDANGTGLVFSGAAGVSEIAICNMALSHLGVGKEIANLETETSQEAAACRRFFSVARDNTLRDYPWPFTTKIQALALIETDPNDEWNYSYRYPSDCLRLRRVLSGIRNDNRQTRVPYKIAQDAAGQLIYTDTENAEVEYTIRETDPSRYPSDFVMAFSLRLASYIAPRLTKGDPFKLGDRALQLHQYEVQKAMASAHVEEQQEELPDSEFIRERE